MGGVLIAGFRLATRMTADIARCRSASALQTYPNMIAQQLTSLRDRLESRAYAGQALADLRRPSSASTATSKRSAGELGRSAQFDRATLLWQQYGPVIKPVVAFDGQPYVDSDESGSSLSSGLAHYGDVKRAQLFARENTTRMQSLLSSIASAQAQASDRAGCGCCCRSACWPPWCSPPPLAISSSRAAAVSAWRAKPGTDPRHPEDGEGRLLPARCGLPDRLGLVERADAHVRPQGLLRLSFEDY